MHLLLCICISVFTNNHWFGPCTILPNRPYNQRIYKSCLERKWTETLRNSLSSGFIEISLATLVLFYHNVERSTRGATRNYSVTTKQSSINWQCTTLVLPYVGEGKLLRVDTGQVGGLVSVDSGQVEGRDLVRVRHYRWDGWTILLKIHWFGNNWK